jgi:putative ABC transport system ATP-binding protein
MDERERTSFRARELSLVFQNENLWPMLSARENVALALRLAGVREPLAIADRALEKFGLGDRSNHVARALSGGEQQRVAVAAAFAREAPLVLADEPTGELDDRNERIVLDALAHLRERRNATVVMVTHSHSVAASADRVVQMRDGKVIA